MEDKLIIILDSNDVKFDYYESEIIRFRRLWTEYRKCTDDRLVIINQLAKDLEEEPDNMFLLALDQIRKGKIR